SCRGPVAHECHAGYVLELLTGIGLATSAGLNAYIPLLTIGLLGRFTGLMELPAGWQWLENDWVLGILAVLLVIELVADKIPIVDHINDVVQTVVRPTSGGLAFGAAASSSTVTVQDPESFFASNQWVPIVIGMAISFGVHLLKALARPVVNATTAGFGAPAASTAEDAVSVVAAVVAILFPILVLVVLVLLVWAIAAVFRRRRRRRDELEALRAENAALRAQAARRDTHDGRTLDL